MHSRIANPPCSGCGFIASTCMQANPDLKGCYDLLGNLALVEENAQFIVAKVGTLPYG